MTKYLLVSAYARGLALEISHIEFPCLESLKNYLFDNHYLVDIEAFLFLRIKNKLAHLPENHVERGEAKRFSAIQFSQINLILCNHLSYLCWFLLVK